MSLVFLKSQNAETNATHNPHEPSRFSNYFTQPLHLEPNSQVALVNTHFFADTGQELEQEGEIQMRIGNLYMNPILQFPLKDRYVNSWYTETSQIARAANMLGIDDNFNHVFEDTAVPAIVGNPSPFELQQEFNAGYNLWWSEADKKIYGRSNQRQINLTFNQGFNCCGANPLINYNQPNGIGVVPAGVNFGATDNRIDFSDLAFHRTNASNVALTAYLAPSNAATPRITGGSSINTGNSFYNTQWAFNRLTQSLIDIGSACSGPSNPANTYPRNNLIAYNNFDAAGGDPAAYGYAMLSSGTGIKQYVGNDTLNAVAELNNGGHTLPSSASSGGYFVYCKGMLPFSTNYYDAGSVGATNAGRVGFSPFFLGVNSHELVENGNGLPTPLENRVAFLQNCDLNMSTDADVPHGALARYIFGVKCFIKGTPANQKLVCQAQILDPTTGSLGLSEYVDVGPELDLFELCAGSNTATTPPTAFGGGTLYDINVTGGPNTPANLIWRFRWVSPYQMAIEFMLEIQGVATSYDVRQDTPYLPAGAAGDPTSGWCTLYNMNVNGDGATGDTYYIPNFHNGLIMVDYSTHEGSPCYTKGFYDTRLSNRFNQAGALDGITEAFATSQLVNWAEQRFFSRNAGYVWGLAQEQATMMKNVAGGGSDKLVNTTPEKFDTNGRSKKEIYWLVSPTKDLADVAEWQAFGDPNNSIEMYNVGNPFPNPVGLNFGFVDEGASAILKWNKDIDGLGDFVIQGFNPNSALRLGVGALSLHYQLTNLPISSQQGVKATTNKTFYVVNTLCLNDAHGGDIQSGWYCHEVNEKLWIDLNNYSPLDLNKLEILITDDQNVQARNNLKESTDLTIVFRQKPNNAGYRQFAGGNVNVKDPNNPYDVVVAPR